MENQNTSLEKSGNSQLAAQQHGIQRLSIDNLAQAMAAANELKRFVVEQKLSSKIQGKDYVHLSGWQFAGAMLGIYARSQGAECLNYTDPKTGKLIYKYRAYTVLTDQTGREVGAASGICTNAEPNKKDYQEYAIESSAQTRATSKAFRVMLGWMMEAAGFAGTPFDEMEGVSEVTVMVSDELHAELGRLLTDAATLEDLPAKDRQALQKFAVNYRDTPKEDTMQSEAKKLRKILQDWIENYKQLPF